jgi:uncharacterized membrane protein YhaH (DUF805 family)
MRSNMNPFTGILTRSGFLLWSAGLVAGVVVFASLIDSASTTHEGVYWLPLRILFAVIFLPLTFLVAIRRLQNAGISVWLSLALPVPFFGFLLWLALFFIPPKSKRN